MADNDLRVRFGVGRFIYSKRQQRRIVYKSPSQLTGGWISENCSSVEWYQNRGEGVLNLLKDVNTIGGGQSTDYSPFYGQTSVTSVELPDDITVIDDYAFYGCTGLTEFTIGANVTEVGDYAFGGCTNLTVVVCLAEVPPALGGNNFTGVDTLYVPFGSLESYQNDTDWNEAFTTIRPIGYAYITVAAGEHGSASGSGWHKIGTETTISATPDSHYHFTAWSDGNTNATRTITVTEDASYTASFAIDQFTLTVTAGSNGSVTGGGTYAYGTSVEISATPDSHYHFTGWSDGSTDATRTITVTEDASYSASFAIDTFTITVVAGENGSVSGGGTYPYGTSVEISASADEHYHFTGWSDGSTDATRTITVTSDATYTASFAIDQFRITVIAGLNGSVSGGGTYPYGASIEISATPDTHYHFTQWNDGSTDATRTVVVIGDITYTASFAIDTFTITVVAGENGSVTGGGTYPYGTSIEISATPDSGYEFTGWSDSNTDNPRTITVTSDASYTASFQEEVFGMVTYISTNEASGQWVDDNTDTTRNTYDSQTGEGVLYLNRGVTTIGGGNSKNYTPFYGDTGLSYVNLTDSGLTEIDTSAFYGCTDLASASIPNDVTTIGQWAFEGCSSLAGITLPSSLTTIGTAAFSGCSTMNTITIPSSVTNMGSEVFAYCYNLEYAFIQEGITHLSDYTFRDCGHLLMVTLPNTLTSIGSGAFKGCSSLNAITIPANVSAIGDSAFYGCTSLTSIEIPTNVTTNRTISTNLFKGCTSLTSVTLPQWTVTINNSAFEDCSSLRTINIPSTVQYINQDAFKNCSSLPSITIPSSVASIGDGAFGGCSSLTSVTCLSTAPCTLGTGNFTASGDILYVPYSSVSSYQSNSAWSGAFSKIISKDYLIRYTSTARATGSWVNSNTNTGQNVYNSTTHEGILCLKSGVTTLGTGGLTTNENPFYYNTGLTAVDMSNSGLTTLSNYAFSSCSNLAAVNLPTTLTTLNRSVFANCSNLVSVSLPDGLTTIGDYAFMRCGMPALNIPSTVISVSGLSFNYCTSLASITVASGNTTYNDGNGSNCIIETSTNKLVRGCVTTIIPVTVTSIGSSAFSGCTTLTSINIPSGVTTIGDYAFSDCTGLTSINIPNTVTTIGEGAFNVCSGLTSITIPNSVTSIGNTAFQSCYSLTSITIPNSVTSISQYSFNDCYSLTSITIPNSVTSIGGAAFSGCKGLTSITIPNSVTSIGDGAFSSCDFTSVTLGSGLISIGVGAFYYCEYLATVNCLATTPPTLGTDNFGYSNVALYVPAASVSAYQADSEWSASVSSINAIS